MGHSCSFPDELKRKICLDEPLSFFPAEESDLIISLGGDGALLAAGQIAIKADKPLVGINAGRVGYLCAMKFEDLADFDSLIQNCRKINCTLLQVDFEGKRHYALNDVIIGKTNFGKTVDLSVYVKDKLLFHVRGDGLIVTTPTGSTAYNRSAGGPVIEEEVKAIGITSICANVANPPYVVSDCSEVIVKVNHEDAGIYVDSNFLGKYPDELLIKKADKTLTLLK